MYCYGSTPPQEVWCGLYSGKGRRLEIVGLRGVSSSGTLVRALCMQMGVAQEVGAASGSLNAGAELSEEGGVSQFRVQDKSGKQTIISINTVRLGFTFAVQMQQAISN